MGPPKLQDARTVQEFDAIVKSAAKTVVFFWASWSETCKHMEAVLLTLAATHPAAAYVRVEAEEVDDVTERFNVTAVPHFVLLKGNQVAATVEGADAPALTAAVERVVGDPAAAAAAAVAAGAAGAGAAAGEKQQQQEAPGDVVARIERLLRSAPVVLFMKGSAEAPRCGFSRKVVEALQAAGAQPGSYPTVDILQDEPLRQALKAYSNWPTYPQLYVAGELVGGCDIVLEMHQAGELKQLIKEKAPTLAPAVAAGAGAGAAGAAAAANGSSKPAAAAGAANGSANGAAGAAAAAAATEQPPAMSDDELRELTRRAPVMLFMKGEPEAPRCGFSRKVVEALQAAGVPFASFDILTDERVRQGLKAYSNWPTYPQLYAAGELVGGCDIVLEMQQAGELKTAVDELLHRTTEA